MNASESTAPDIAAKGASSRVLTGLGSGFCLVVTAPGYPVAGIGSPSDIV